MLLKTSRLLLCVTAVCALPAAAQAQMFFEADWIALKLDDGSNAQYIAGPDAFGGGGDYDYEPGYRITLGGALGDYEVYGIVTQADQWRDSGQLTLANALVLDENTMSAFVPTPNVLGFNNLLFDAATAANADPNLDETSEIELIQPGALAQMRARTNYLDFEISAGTNRNLRPWRAAIGWRQIKLDGWNDFAVSGTFDALDVDDGAIFGDATNDLNDALTDNAFAAAGFDVVTTGGFDAAATMAGPDTMTVFSSAVASNELNGAQATFAYRAFQGSWVTIEGIGKAGLYHNNIGARVTETVSGSVNSSALYTRTFTNSKSTAAFAGTLGFRVITSLTDYINLVAGYEGLFLTGVATSSDQTQGVHRDLLGNLVYDIALGDVIIHGANVGIEVTW